LPVTVEAMKKTPLAIPKMTGNGNCGRWRLATTGPFAFGVANTD
jgi:hypothetical protein